MNKRPLPITIVAVVYICAGILGVAYHASEFKSSPFEKDAILAVLVRLAAVVAGAFLLMGKNWARWLAVAWIGFHVILSAFHTIPELAMHTALLIVIAYFLLRPTAAQYFRDGTTPK